MTLGIISTLKISKPRSGIFTTFVSILLMLPMRASLQPLVPPDDSAPSTLFGHDRLTSSLPSRSKFVLYCMFCHVDVGISMSHLMHSNRTRQTRQKSSQRLFPLSAMNIRDDYQISDMTCTRPQFRILVVSTSRYCQTYTPPLLRQPPSTYALSQN